MVRRAPAVLLLTLVFATPSFAAAQEVDEASDLEARGLFSAGEGAYSAGRFEIAYEYFQRAYELSPRPALLYNLGLAAASAGHEREAVAAFERYLVELPDAPNHVVAEARIASMRAEIAEEDAVAARLLAAEDATARDATRIREERLQAAHGQRDAGWAVVASGAGLVVIGAVLFGVGFADVAAVEGAAEGTPWPSVNDAASRAPILTGIGIGAGATGLAALGVGLGLALSVATESESATEAPQVGFVPVVDPMAGIFGLSARGTF